MNHQNKTEELKETIERIINDSMYYILDEADSRYLAGELIEEGYRKASEVAMEIFDEIQARFKQIYEEGKKAPFQCLVIAFNETKKKYTEESENEKTKN